MDLLTALLDLLIAFGAVIWTLIVSLVPWTPLIAWIAFWTFAVNWVRLREIQLQGGMIGIVLLGLTAILVWGVVAPPESGTHSLLGLRVSNFAGKAMYVTALIVIMQLCGAVQLSGCCDRLLNLELPAGGGDDGHHGGHDDGHAGHGGSTGGHGH